MIVVIDYGTGNLKSVANALKLFGEEVKISNKKEDIINSERIVLPGVGTFFEGMKNLRELDIIDTLNEEVIKKKKPFLGICLGMHLLATRGFEGGICNGLNWVPGEVKRFELKENLRIPHMGWNNISLKKESSLFENIPKNKDYYFVHCFHFIPDLKEYIVATCDYGIEFVSAIQKDNIFATQFHPEKSHQNGLRILKNFIKWKPENKNA